MKTKQTETCFALIKEARTFYGNAKRQQLLCVLYFTCFKKVINFLLFLQGLMRFNLLDF